MADRQARRGLNTGSARWRALRAQVLREQPLHVGDNDGLRFGLVDGNEFGLSW